MCELRSAGAKVACAAIAVLALAGCGHERKSSPVSTYGAHGVTVELPKGWQTATANLTPNLGDPRQVIAVGTYPLRYRPHDCAQVPVSALEDLGSRDAFIELEERGVDPGSSWSEFPARPPHFGRGLGGPSEATQCVPGTRMDEHWFGFTDKGRHFYALVAFGPDVPKATQDEAWAVLDSLKVDPSVRPDWDSLGRALQP
jgi:hypothetical protein